MVYGQKRKGIITDLVGTIRIVPDVPGHLLSIGRVRIVLVEVDDPVGKLCIDECRGRACIGAAVAVSGLTAGAAVRVGRATVAGQRPERSSKYPNAPPAIEAATIAPR